MELLFSSLLYHTVTVGVRGIELEEALSSTSDMNTTVIDRLAATKREQSNMPTQSKF